MSEPHVPMGPMFQVRQWLAEATSAERGLAGVTLLLVVALLAWAFSPAESSLTHQLDSSSSATGQFSDDGGTKEGATPASSIAGAEGALAPDTVPASTTASAAAGQTGTAATTPGDASPSAVKPTASDRGITPSEIKVGFTILDLAGARDGGLAGAGGIRDDTRQVIAALVKYANDNGGVHGRKVVGVTRNVDVISADDQRAKCLELTRDEKVFAVVDTFDFLFRPTRACITVENKTPLITSTPGTSDEVAKAAPLQVSTWSDENERAREWVDAARANGFFDPKNGFKKLGLLTDNCDRYVVDDPVQGLKARLRAIGVTEWSEFVADCDVSSLQRSGSPAVLQHRSDGVSNVLLATWTTAITAYLIAANSSAWKPKYYASDFRGITNDSVAKNFNAAQWDRVQAVTTSRSGELVAGKPLPPKAIDCSRRLEAAGLAPIKNYDSDLETLLLCEHFDLFLAAARAAPVNFTRTDWGSAVTRITQFRSALVDATRFGPNRFAGAGDTVALLEWRRECTCWHQVRGFQQSR